MALPVTNLVRAVLRLRCPICLEGRVFRTLFETHRRCARCGFFFTRESGYFLGSVYFGYAATVGVAGLTWFLLSYVLGMGWSLRVLIVLMALTLVFPVWFFRYSRMLWLSMDLYFNPPVAEDFETRGR